MGDGWRDVAELMGRACGAQVVVWHARVADGGWTGAGWTALDGGRTLPPQALAALDDGVAAEALERRVVATPPGAGLSTDHPTQPLRGLLGFGAYIGLRLAPRQLVVAWVGLAEQPPDGRLDALAGLVERAACRGTGDCDEQLDSQLGHRRRLEAVDRLVSGVAHELNNPLQTVVGNAEMLAGMKLPEAAHRRAGRVLSGARRCQEVVDGLLKLKRRGRGLSEPVVLEDVVRRAARLIEGEVADQRLLLKVQVVDPVPAMTGDEAGLQHAVENVVRNACQAVADRRDPEVGILLEGSGERVRVVVTDNGEGMSPEIAQRAFEPFFTTRGVGAGKGLGLSIALGIVEEHGGLIEIHSRQPGARVEISFPVVRRI